MGVIWVSFSLTLSQKLIYSTKRLLEEHSDPCSHAAVFTDTVRQGIGGRTGEQISSLVQQPPSWSAHELQ